MKKQSFTHIIIWLLAVLSVIGLCACSSSKSGEPVSDATVSGTTASSSENEQDAAQMPAVSNPETNAFDLIKHIYTNEELEEIDAQASDLTLAELNARYPVECLRQDSSGYYTCYFASSDRLLQLMYDADGLCIGVLNRFSTLYSDDAVDTIRVGESVSEIQERFPDDETLFLFLSTGSGEPRVSTFFTRGGYCVTVSYGDDAKVSSIDKVLF